MKNYNKLEKELHSKITIEILIKYGRKQRNGRLMKCTPSVEERVQSGKWALINWQRKIIYDNKEVADAAAKEFKERLNLSYRSYQCPRSSKGHNHLTKV